ncbi:MULTISPECIES: class I SAM-dependent methyltransferase [Haloarcula]|uniref:class I SAM-dependent methyltransferase n=1 Tax=Haloarcula TaxID=2237 RepID=UPI000F8F1C2D|nr:MULTISPECIES: class I SAM-dependent methyltransferase [Haloarcula]NHX40788.1 class I SAM-dependent methyltransferase [Haloarcula sp. R1-2]NHX41143.1 class I SAM-dependent methyltransferase [Haloarcula sp. R1-2]
MDPDDVRDDWASRSGKFSPAYYAELGPNEVSETLVNVLDHYVHDDARIIELGCGSGRHLAHLQTSGYGNLTGIDINDESFDVMAEHYPQLADSGTFHTGALEDIVTEFEDDAFDVAYSVETLQHIHPDDAWVFEEIARIAGDLLVIAENEGNSPERGRADTDVSYVDDDFPLYHRNWKQVFSELGFAQLIREPTSRDTIRVFRAP